MSFFRELLRIKNFRETKAELNVGKQRGVLAQAVSHEETSQEKLRRFQAYAVEHERAMYADLCSRIVKLSAIEDVQLAVVGLRDQEQQHQKTLEEAEKDRQAQARRMVELRQIHSDAQRAKQKFVELAQVFADEKIKEFERKEDAELEEVAELRRDRTEWEEHHEETA